MKLSVLIFFLVSVCLNDLYGQKGVDTSVYRQVLQKNQKGKEFVFDYSIPGSADKTWLKYLGNVTTNQGRSYKILTSIWVWGYSRRGTTRILIFDLKNRYVGQYVMSMTYEAPVSVSDNKMVFKFSGSSGCNLNLNREISFTEGIPKHFFLECKDGMGDIYNFDDTL